MPLACHRGVSSTYFNEVGNGSAYRKGRDVATSLGLVPKQHSSGVKDLLLGISKKGNRLMSHTPDLTIARCDLMLFLLLVF